MPTELDADKLKAERERLDLTQEEAAKAAGVGSRQRWNDLESGRRKNVSLDTLGRIADAFGIDPCKLLKRLPKAKGTK